LSATSSASHRAGRRHDQRMLQDSQRRRQLQ
jgi:hypothetical protein